MTDTMRLRNSVTKVSDGNSTSIATKTPGSGIPALIGDPSNPGVYRIMVLGNSGAGKTTLSRTLSSMLGLHFFSMDALSFRPGWIVSPIPEYQERVRKEMRKGMQTLEMDSGSEVAARTRLGWVTDSYENFVADDATDIIWLDPPLILYLPRLILRTLGRILHLQGDRYRPCAPGCYETPRMVFLSRRDSVIWWSITHHRRAQMRNGERLDKWGLPESENGNELEGRKMRRISADTSWSFGWIFSWIPWVGAGAIYTRNLERWLDGVRRVAEQ